MHPHHNCVIAADAKSQVSMEPNRSEKQEPLKYIAHGMAVGFLSLLLLFL